VKRENKDSGNINWNLKHLDPIVATLLINNSRILEFSGRTKCLVMYTYQYLNTDTQAFIWWPQKILCTLEYTVIMLYGKTLPPWPPSTDSSLRRSIFDLSIGYLYCAIIIILYTQWFTYILQKNDIIIIQV